MDSKYEVALSFVRENRDFARSIAKGLEKNGVKVFYDENHQAEMWGENIGNKMREVYGEQSRYCIMILTDDYLKRIWTNHERQIAIERLIDKGVSYVLPVRLDGFTEKVPGLSEHIAYIAANSSEPEKIVSIFLEKIGKIKNDYFVKPTGLEQSDGPQKMISMQQRSKSLDAKISQNIARIRKLQEDVFGTYLGALGEKHPLSVQAMVYLAMTLKLQGELQLSEDLLKKADGLIIETRDYFNPKTVNYFDEILLRLS